MRAITIHIYRRVEKVKGKNKYKGFFCPYSLSNNIIQPLSASKNPIYFLHRGLYK